MSLRKTLLVTVLASLMSPAVFAYNYGMAGCGLGSLVFKDKPGMVQLFAATLNVWGLQTSAITSGTSQCDADRGQTASLYININYQALQKEIAQGQGETINGLAEIYGCDNTEKFKSTLNKSFNHIYPGHDVAPEQTSEKIFSVIKETEALKACSIFS